MRIGTRSSPLALKQANIVKKNLARQHNIPEKNFEIIPMITKGDQLKGKLIEFGGKGLFTKELDTALINNEIDIAVHSMKDVATTLPTGITIPSILEREDPRDVWVSAKYPKLSDLPKGAKVGTCSLRRSAQLLHLRPDIEIVTLRGNVGSRFQKIQDGIADGTLLALAGLKRLDAHHMIGEILSQEVILPAVAQGAIGIACRTDDLKTIKQLKQLNHYDTYLCVSAERAFLKELDGSCRTPIAAHAALQQDHIHLTGLWASTDGKVAIKQSSIMPIQDYVKSSIELAQFIKSMLPTDKLIPIQD